MFFDPWCATKAQSASLAQGNELDDSWCGMIIVVIGVTEECNSISY